MSQIFKYILIVTFSLGMIFATPHTAYAGPLDYCDGLSEEDYSSNPLAIICPFVRIINILVLSAGAVFVGMILIFSYKYASSLGDPKAALGANLTATYAVLGLLAVIGVYTILAIIVNTTGVNEDFAKPDTLYGKLKHGLCNVLTNSTEGGPLVENLPCP